MNEEPRKIAHRHALKIRPLSDGHVEDPRDWEFKFCPICNRTPDRGEMIGWAYDGA